MKTCHPYIEMCDIPKYQTRLFVNYFHANGPCVPRPSGLEVTLARNILDDASRS